jgi:uncharacterized OsmC-like protein
MSLDDIAVAMRRAEGVLAARPVKQHPDAEATAVWHGGTRVVSSHSNGATVATDMSVALGGTGDQVSPGWLFRAGLASCAATCIVMTAAARGVGLTKLEVVAASTSDARGLLGMKGEDGTVVYPGPSDVELRVTIAARGASEDQLRALVEDSQRVSPIPNAVERATPVALSIAVEPA